MKRVHVAVKLNDLLVTHFTPDIINSEDTEPRHSCCISQLCLCGKLFVLASTSMYVRVRTSACGHRIR